MSRNKQDEKIYIKGVFIYKSCEITSKYGLFW